MLERLTGKDAISARQLARETGISQETLSRWLQEARSLPLMPSDRRANKTWTIDEKVRQLTIKNSDAQTIKNHAISAGMRTLREDGAQKVLAGMTTTAEVLMITTQDMEYGKALHYLRELLVLIGLSDDAREGIAAFFEKRSPEWKGR